MNIWKCLSGGKGSVKWYNCIINSKIKQNGKKNAVPMNKPYQGIEKPLPFLACGLNLAYRRQEWPSQHQKQWQ